MADDAAVSTAGTETIEPGGPAAVGADHFAEMFERNALASEAVIEAENEKMEGEPAAESVTEGKTQEIKGKEGAAPGAGDDDLNTQVRGLISDLKESRAELAALKKQIGEQKPAAAAETTAQADAPWKSKLLALPKAEGKAFDAQGNVTQSWGSDAEFYAEMARVQALNVRTEQEGVASQEREARAAEERKQQAEIHRAERQSNYHTKDVPSYVKEIGITVEQFNADLAKAPTIAILGQQESQWLAGAMVTALDDIPEFSLAAFSHAMAKAPADFLNAEATKIMALPPERRAAALGRWVGSMHGRLSAGLGFDGKPLAGAKTSLTTGAGAAQRRNSTTVVPATGSNGGAGAAGGATTVGTDHFREMERNRQRKAGR